jgi:hypothetical protein
MFQPATKFRTFVRALGRKNILLEQLPAFFCINKNAEERRLHTSTLSILHQEPKKAFKIDLPQLKVPEIKRDELLTFKGMETDFPCLTRK